VPQRLRAASPASAAAGAGASSWLSKATVRARDRRRHTLLGREIHDLLPGSQAGAVYRIISAAAGGGNSIWRRRGKMPRS